MKTIELLRGRRGQCRIKHVEIVLNLFLVDLHQNVQTSYSFQPTKCAFLKVRMHANQMCTKKKIDLSVLGSH